MRTKQSITEVLQRIKSKTKRKVVHKGAAAAKEEEEVVLVEEKEEEAKEKLTEALNALRALRKAKRNRR